MRHFISLDQLETEEIVSLLQAANVYEQKEYRPNKPFFAGNLFFEPSTRTKTSFIVAERKLGMEVLDFHTESSSVVKGESLYDTVRTFESIGADLLVIRHHSDHWIKELKDGQISTPIINAGAGKAEHPTQGMLDLLTIYQEFATFNNLNVVIAGDIKHSRVAHSNARVLNRLGANVYLCAAAKFTEHELPFPYITMDEAVEVGDVVMLLRVQHERHEDKTEIANYLRNYGLTKQREQRMKEHAIIMHPAPINRGMEIDSELVECKRSRIFKQMTNGVYMRMAIMVQLLQEWGKCDEHFIEASQRVIAG